MARDRMERVALTESGFRVANERMARWEDRAGRPDERAAYFCECGVAGCREPISLTRHEYDSVRAHQRHFLVQHDHIIEDLEEEVERHAGYSVIEKPDVLAPLLLETDPRSETDGPARAEAEQLADEIGDEPQP